MIFHKLVSHTFCDGWLECRITLRYDPNWIGKLFGKKSFTEGFEGFSHSWKNLNTGKYASLKKSFLLYKIWFFEKHKELTR